MPFFSRQPEPAAEPEPPAPEPAPEPAKHKSGLFHRRSHSPTPSNATAHTASTHQTADKASRHSSITARSLLTRFGPAELDPSIVQARERVMSAEAAEREADRALVTARESVREARDHVRRLEIEAKEEARRAKIKQYHAREVSKRGKQLGRELRVAFPNCSVLIVTGHDP